MQRLSTASLTDTKSGARRRLTASRRVSGNIGSSAGRGGRRLGSPIHWYGGKGRLAAKLVKLLAPHDCFVEVFGGAGSVLLAKPPSAREVWNDIHFDLYALFRILKDRRRRARLLEMIEFTPHGRGQFEACLAERRNGKSGISVRRAWTTMVALNQGRNGCLVDWPNYAYNRRTASNVTA